MCANAHSQTQTQLGMVCKQFVERSLHDPRDADLGGWTEARIAQRKDGTWTVRFQGRAKNAYGALRLATFECIVRYTAPDSFNAVSLRAF